MHRALPWVVAVLALIGGGLCFWHERTEVVRLRGELGETRTIRIAGAPTSSPHPVPAASPLAPAPVARPAAPEYRSFDAMRRIPEYRDLWRKRELQGIQRQYAPILAQMNLPPDRVAKLHALLLEGDERDMDVREAARLTGLPSRSTITNDLAEATQHELDAEIKSLLGEPAFEQMHDLIAQRAVAQQLNESLGLDLSGAGHPLTPEQLTGLVGIYRDNPALTAGPEVFVEAVDPAIGMNPALQKVLERIGGVLTPEQTAIVRDYFLDQTRFYKFVLGR